MLQCWSAQSLTVHDLQVGCMQRAACLGSQSMHVQMATCVLFWAYAASTLAPTAPETCVLLFAEMATRMLRAASAY